MVTTVMQSRQVVLTNHPVVAFRVGHTGRHIVVVSHGALVHMDAHVSLPARSM